MSILRHPIVPRGCHLIPARIILFALPFLLCSLLQAQPVVPGLFSDHMVLQQGHEIPVWGWADAGETIDVTIGTANSQHDHRKGRALEN